MQLASRSEHRHRGMRRSPAAPAAFAQPIDRSIVVLKELLKLQSEGSLSPMEVAGNRQFRNPSSVSQQKFAKCFKRSSFQGLHRQAGHCRGWLLRRLFAGTAPLLLAAAAAATCTLQGLRQQC